MSATARHLEDVAVMRAAHGEQGLAEATLLAARLATWQILDGVRRGDVDVGDVGLPVVEVEVTVRMREMPS